MGIEPTYQAWKASVLPLNYAREHTNYSYLSAASQRKLAQKFEIRGQYTYLAND